MLMREDGLVGVPGTWGIGLPPATRQSLLQTLVSGRCSRGAATLRAF